MTKLSLKKNLKKGMMKRNILISFTDLLFWVLVHYFKNFLEKCSHGLLLKIYQQFSLYKIDGVIWILKEKEIVGTNLIFLMNILVTTFGFSVSIGRNFFQICLFTKKLKRLINILILALPLTKEMFTINFYIMEKNEYKQKV